MSYESLVGLLSPEQFAQMQAVRQHLLVETAEQAAAEQIPVEELENG